MHSLQETYFFFLFMNEGPKSSLDPERLRLYEELARGTIDQKEFEQKEALYELAGRLAKGEISNEEFIRRQEEIEGPPRQLSPDVEKVRDRLKAGIDELIVHGDYSFQEGVGSLRIHPDLDALGGIFLMDLAGIDYRAVTSVEKGTWKPGGVHIDTGERKQFRVEDDGSIFFDHHGSEREGETSATQIVYETLVEAGLLRKEPWLDRFVSFVTEIDNLTYPIDEEALRKTWWQSLYGTYKVLPISFIANYFREGKDPTKPFSQDDKDRVVGGRGQTLREICERTRGLVVKSANRIPRAIRTMEREGVKIETPELGKVVINRIPEGKGNQMPMGFTAVKALGYDTYVLWNEGTNSFFISSQTKSMSDLFEKIHDSIPSAKLIRGTMIISPPTEPKSDLAYAPFLQALGLHEGMPSVPTPEPTHQQEEDTGPPPQSLTEFMERLFRPLSLGTPGVNPEDLTRKKEAIERAYEGDDARTELLTLLARGTISPTEYEVLKTFIPKEEDAAESFTPALEDNEEYREMVEELRRAQQEWERNERAAIKEELKETAPEEKKRARIGLHTLGFWLEEKKNRFFAKALDGTSTLFDKGTTGDRFFAALRNGFLRDAEKAEKNLEKSEKQRMKNALTLSALMLKYGRLAGDTLGWTAGFPLGRLAMLAGMGMRRAGEAAQEARLANQEYLEREVWTVDAAKAEDEARSIFAEAEKRAGGTSPSRKELEDAYRGRIPTDILKRISDGKEGGFVSALSQRFMTWRIESEAKKIKFKLETIDLDPALSQDDREKAKDTLFRSYERQLSALDKTVTRYGTVDGLVMMARFAEKGGKALTYTAMGETLVVLAQQFWEHGIPSILSTTDGALDQAKRPPLPEFQTKDIFGGKKWEDVIGRRPTDEELNTILQADPKKLGANVPALLEEMKRAARPLTREEINSFLEKGPPEIPQGTNETPSPSPEEKKTTDEEPPPTEAPEKVTPREELIIQAKPGDSVWKITERTLGELYNGKFSSLDEAQKTYVIDAIKDRVGERKLKVGEGVDFTGIFNDKEEMARIFERANLLDDAVRERIEGNNAAIQEWLDAHPREELTAARVEGILQETARAEAPGGEYGHDAGLGREGDYFGVTQIEIEKYGTRGEALFAKAVGLDEYEYKAVREEKVKHFLEQIPSADEARGIRAGRIPGRTIDLPHFAEYDDREFEGHIKLANILRHYLEKNSNRALLENMKVEEFLKLVAPKEGILTARLSDIAHP